MKKWLYILLMIPLFCISCLEDESNEELKALNPIKIENINLWESYSVYMGDTLKIQPLIYCEGVPDAKMSFEWKLFGEPIVPTVIDSTMYCEAKLVVPPYSNPYTLRLTIKDETTGISRIETFNVKVLSSFGEGLIVADTKDGKNSDLSLVMSRHFSSQIPKTNNKIKIFNDLWSQSNGSKLQGRVLDAITTSYGSNRSLTVITTEHLYRADYYDYFNISDEMDGGMFTVVPPHVGHGFKRGFFSLYTGTTDEFMCLDGLITHRGMQHNNRRHTYTVYPPHVTDYNITLMCSPMYNDVYAYDAMGHRMFFMDFRKAQIPQNQSAGEFDVRDLSAYEPFFMGETNQGVTLLTKEIATGRYKGLVMYTRRSWDPEIPTYAKAIFDFSNAEDIQNAKFFEVNKREDVIYYATDTKLYSTPTANINSQVQWEADAATGEKITGLKLYKWYGGQCDYENLEGGDNKVNTASSMDRLMMITTYNEMTKDGKVYCVPIVTYGLGGLEQNKDFHVVLSGFGEILGVYKQKE